MKNHSFLRGCLLTAAAVSVLGLSAFASTRDSGIKGAWGQNANGWYWMDDNTTDVLKNTWTWIDSDDDGIAEQYYFGSDGYMATNAVISGYQLNTSGQLVTNGVIQTNHIEIAASDIKPHEIDGGSVLGVSRTFDKGQLGTSVAFLDKINTYRSENGLSPLSMDSKLNEFAEMRAKELTSNFSRTSSGEDPFDKLDKIYGSRVNVCSDAMVQDDTLDGAFNSMTIGVQGKSVLLSSRFNKCGIGICNGSYYIVGAKL